MTSSPCPFCPPDPARVFHKDQTVFALWDGFPVNPGHALIIPYRHVGSWFEATEEEQGEILRTIPLVRERIEANHAPAGYNIGVNVGFAAGQTVDHLHMHVIPRYPGDVRDPTGGVRHVIPSRGNYLKDKGAGSLPPPPASARDAAWPERPQEAGPEPSSA
jgi:ATP adenylyltransferase